MHIWQKIRKSKIAHFQKVTSVIAAVLCRHREGLKGLWGGSVWLQLTRLCWVHSRTLDIWQCHNIVANLLHLRPVDSTRYHCGWRDLLENLLLTSCKREDTQFYKTQNKWINKTVERTFTCKTITILNLDLPGTIVNDVPGGYWAPREAINSLLFVNCGEVTIKPWKTNKEKNHPHQFLTFCSCLVFNGIKKHLNPKIPDYWQ